MMADEPPEGEPVSQEAMLDEIIQMNIGEIRTLINQMLMRPVVAAVTDDANRDKAVRLLDSLGDDEARHISYTADIIDEIGDRAMSVHYMTLRQREFNGITTSELGLGSDRAPIFE
jgi:Mg/Co/Ni transporter MgtE